MKKTLELINFETLFDKSKNSVVVYFFLEGLTYHFYFEQYKCFRYSIGGPGHPLTRKTLEDEIVSEEKTIEGCVEQVKKFMVKKLGEEVLELEAKMHRLQDIRMMLLNK